MLIKVIDPETRTISWQETSDLSKFHAVNAAGEYLGLVTRGTADAIQVPDAPPQHTPHSWKWSVQNSSWEPVFTLAQVVKTAQQEIDGQAGAARLRYITAIPGQDSLYTQKRQQAEKFIEAYKTNPNIPAPGLVVAEAEATETSNIAAATAIVAEANAWDVTAAKIEKIRRQGKLSVAAAASPAVVSSRLNTVLALLKAA